MWNGVSLSFWFAFSWKLVMWASFHMFVGHLYIFFGEVSLVCQLKMLSYFSFYVKCLLCVFSTLLLSCPVVSSSSWPHGKFVFFFCQILDLEMFSPILWDLKIFSWQCSFIYKSFKFWWVLLSFLLFPVFWGSYLSDHYLLKCYEDLLLFFFF